MKSSTTKYGWVAITLHWIVAFLILSQLASGFRATGLTEDVAKASILQVHMAVGIIIDLFHFRTAPNRGHQRRARLANRAQALQIHQF